MRYREQLNIIFMRDNGPRRSFRMRRSRFYLWVVFFACLPCLCVLLAIQCWLLWQENTGLREKVERAEGELQAVELRVEKLEVLEDLLKEESTPAREIILRRLAMNPAAEAADQAEASPPNQAEPGDEGPGHEEFPVLDTGRVIVDNVQPRLVRGNRLRIGVDLRNPENQPMLSGDITMRLITADGRDHDLAASPQDVGNFRISRFKRTVMTAPLPRGESLENAQVILEVRTQDGEPIYRNIYSVQQ